ncbi:MAG: chromate transporter [Oscillospiraceae bacterium]|nr:chromate transporter [Oscillospiraceae bacterium]MBQ4315708.1 chromate transporter [Oscillospiraceae bacterium]MBQ7055249.1 chromate transporter [Oscillospiraceae bacterium]
MLHDILQLFLIFFRVGAFTFGGGYAMIPILEREFVTDRGWITGEDMLNYVAIGQSTPGVIAVNMATFIGYRRRGFWGALLATLGVITPSLIIITVIAAFISNFSEFVYVQKALAGINISVAVILVSAVWDLGKKSVTDMIGLALAVIAFIAVVVFDVNSIWLILFALIVGISVKGGIFKK